MPSIEISLGQVEALTTYEETVARAFADAVDAVLSAGTDHRAPPSARTVGQHRGRRVEHGVAMARERRAPHFAQADGVTPFQITTGGFRGRAVGELVDVTTDAVIVEVAGDVA